MNRRFAAAHASRSSAFAAAILMSAMAGSAIAESPSLDSTPYAGARTRAEVKAEVMAHRSELSAAGSEYRLQSQAQPFAGTRSRAEVQAETLSQPAALSSAANEWTLQANAPQERMSTITRAQATAAYIASRDQVRAMNSEDSGSSYFAQMPRQTGTTLFASNQDQR
ncbi:hypothetical protein [Ramlibacter sp.]|uniref:hypothetical protein n=1 Tax=Ramlibacter sp. TaxID=1917967 RepID=UPI002D677944|nr:hypothetical protein [Ramlibacter sp.]HYD77201.1 hypothetical protein [Ramlibacter sp.]